MSTPAVGDSAGVVLVSGEYPALAEVLAKWGFTPVETLFDFRLPGPVAYHPDMQACVMGREIFVLRDSPLKAKLAGYGLSVRETEKQPQKRYPGDVLCNGFVWGPWLVANPRTLDLGILEAARALGLGMLRVRQGYAGCSVARVDGNAAITADLGMAKCLERAGFRVLRIRPGFISLPGYDTGFIGGCCAKLAPDILTVSGRLDSHPDGKRMKDFVESCGVSIWEMTDMSLTDVGGILRLV